MFIGGLSWQTSPGKCATYSIVCTVMFVRIMTISMCTSACDASLSQNGMDVREDGWCHNCHRCNFRQQIGTQRVRDAVVTDSVWKSVNNVRSTCILCGEENELL